MGQKRKSSLYSITPSAQAMSVGGTVRPSAAFGQGAAFMLGDHRATNIP
jgi:hypothetical protein